MADKSKGGRPPIYKNPEDLSSRIDEYFEYVKGEFIEKETINTITFQTEFVLGIGKGEPKTKPYLRSVSVQFLISIEIHTGCFQALFMVTLIMERCTRLKRLQACICLINAIQI